MIKLFIISIIILSGCTDKSLLHRVNSLKRIIIYKTRNNYDNKVPVKLSSDKNRIISYPAMTDLYINDEFRKPIPLRDGFLLDVKGISLNTVFLDITYVEYSKLTEIDLDYLFKNISDFEPFIEIYDCGPSTNYRNIIEQLNDKIQKNELGSFNKIK